MKKRTLPDTREIGLEIGLIFANHFLKTEHLHYGYWPDDLPVELFNLPQAQEKYSDFICSHIPEGTRTLLDVGCGVGRNACKLINRGYQVDCVSPSPVLTEHARTLLGDKSHIFECRYEHLHTENRYDVVLFCESFQYIPLEKALQNSLEFLHDGGYLLISDFFKTDVKGESALGGGHKLSKFYDIISKYSFYPVEDIDMTHETAPNLKIVNDVCINVGLPTWNLIMYYLNTHYPFVSKVLQWKYRKKINTINRKYFSGERNEENFKLYKSYRLLLYKKIKSTITY